MFDEVRQLVETRFKAQWAIAVSPAVAYVFEEVPAPQAKEFVRLTVIPGQGDRINLSTTRKVVELVGVVILQIFTAKGGGTARAKKLGDLAAPIFELQQFLQGAVVIDFRAGYMVKAGAREDYYQENLTWPFESRQVK